MLARIVCLAIMVHAVSCSREGGVLERHVDHDKRIGEGERGGFPFGNNLTSDEPVRIAVTMPITSRCVYVWGATVQRVWILISVSMGTYTCVCGYMRVLIPIYAWIDILTRVLYV